MTHLAGFECNITEPCCKLQSSNHTHKHTHKRNPAECVSPVSHPPLQTHTCPHTDKASTTGAPNVFAHRCRLNALSHWMTWAIYSDAPLNPRGNLDWDRKKRRKIRHDLKPFRGMNPEVERRRYMSLSLNMTVSRQGGQSLTWLMNTAGPSCITEQAHIMTLGEFH